jgi:hypothetical protein
MELNASTPAGGEDLDATWRAREGYWRRKLGRLRLGVEPIEEQLARYRRVTWGLTDVCAVLAVMFFAIFAAFGRPVFGLVLDAIMFLPIALGAWADYALMASRARRYLAEADRFSREKKSMRSAPLGE